MSFFSEKYKIMFGMKLTPVEIILLRYLPLILPSTIMIIIFQLINWCKLLHLSKHGSVRKGVGKVL